MVERLIYFFFMLLAFTMLIVFFVVSIMLIYYTIIVGKSIFLGILIIPMLVLINYIFNKWYWVLSKDN